MQSLSAENYKLWLEKMVNKITRRYTLFFVSYFLLLYLGSLVFSYLDDPVREIYIEWILGAIFSGYFLWIACAILAAYFSRKLRDKVLETVNVIRPRLVAVPESTLNFFFKSRKQLIPAAVAALIALSAVLLSWSVNIDITMPIFKDGNIKGAYIPTRDMPFFSFFFALFLVSMLFLLGYFYWICFGVFSVVWNISRQDVKLDTVDPEKRGGLKPLAGLMLYSSLAFFFTTLLAAVFLIFAPPFPKSLAPLRPLILMLFIIFSLIYFFVPLLFISKKVGEKKKTWLLESKRLLGNTIDKLKKVSVLDKDEYDKLFKQFEVYKFEKGEIEAIDPRPFDVSILMKLFGSVFLPVIALLLRILILPEIIGF